MKRPIPRILMACCSLLALLAVNVPARAQNEPTLDAARKARDLADVSSLRKLIEQARTEAQQQNTAEAYERLAQFQLWLCEAAHGHNDDQLIRQSAQDGVAAAEKAVALNPNSSEAHRLAGDSLGELIPQVIAGGMRYGARSTSELDKALDLDPRNVNAYIGRAIGYYYTPNLFGGSREKAIELLKKAIELDPSSDTAHIWLAQVDLAAGQHDAALQEINEARRLNPERGFAKHVYALVSGTPSQHNSR